MGVDQQDGAAPSRERRGEGLEVDAPARPAARRAQRVALRHDPLERREVLEEPVARRRQVYEVAGIGEQPEEVRVALAGAGGEHDVLGSEERALAPVVGGDRLARGGRAARLGLVARRRRVARSLGERRGQRRSRRAKPDARRIRLAEVEHREPARAPRLEAPGERVRRQVPGGAAREHGRRVARRPARPRRGPVRAAPAPLLCEPAGAMSAAKPPPEPALSATILLVRDGARGLEVFMVQRHHRIDFATGAMVFPGGKLEEGDFDPALRARTRGCEGLADAELALRAGAIRETFEEARVLLARRRGSAELLSGAEVLAIEGRQRAALEAHALRIDALVRDEDLELACDRLVPFAHWITPEFMPKRFDTWFFLVPAPEDQVAVHDGREGVDSHWIRPADAIAEAEAGRRTIIFPTLLNVKKLGRSVSVAEAQASAREGKVVTVLPRVVETAAGSMLRIPAEAGYEISEAPVEALR